MNKLRHCDSKVKKMKEGDMEREGAGVDLTKTLGMFNFSVLVRANKREMSFGCAVFAQMCCLCVCLVRVLRACAQLVCVRARSYVCMFTFPTLFSRCQFDLYS